MNSPIFRRHPDCKILIPGERAEIKSAVAKLLAAIDGGTSILIDPSAPTMSEHLAIDMSVQRLYCKSSGSTDQAKVICRMPASWIASFEVNACQYHLTETDSYAVLGAFSHSLTQYAMLEGIHLGADLCICSDLSPRTQWGALRDERITVLYATPAQLRLLLVGAKNGSEMLTDLRYVFCGGGKLDKDCRQDMALLCPNADILEFYGASETSFISISDASTPEGSVGKAYPGVAISVRDEANMPTDQVGEIWVSSPYLFDGYAEGSSQDTRWDGSFVSVGEMGRLDHQGHLFLKGRKSRMITVADQNVFLEDVEAALISHPDISIAAVVPQKDPMRGHVVVAFVEATKEDSLEEKLLSLCRKTLAPQAVPKEFIFLDSIPMLPAGKPDLVALTGKLEQDR